MSSLTPCLYIICAFDVLATKISFSLSWHTANRGSPVVSASVVIRSVKTNYLSPDLDLPLANIYQANLKPTFIPYGAFRRCTRLFLTNLITFYESSIFLYALKYAITKNCLPCISPELIYCLYISSSL